MTRPRHLLLASFAIFLVALVSVTRVHAQWGTPSRAFHKDTAFPLEGRHLTVACAECHVNGQYKGTPTTCVGCHWLRRQDDPYRTRLGTNCEQCHRPTSWKAVSWNHTALTGMPLNAAHLALGCDGCHKNNQFIGADLSCSSCHMQQYLAAKTPDHTAAGFPTTCDVCHRAADATFAQGRFDHNTVFPLIGLHLTVACTTCHVNSVFAGTPRDCVGCHRTDYNRTTSPNHASAGFSTACDTCHKASDPGWLTATFNHSTFFPLVGLHTTAVCTACHVNGQYAATPTTCAGCHLTDYNKTTNPNHAASGFSTACDQCHKATDSSWLTANFNHSSFYALVGVHATVACTTCHVNGQYAGTPTTCVGCHLANYNATTNPNHVAAGFSTACDTCHKATDTTWLQAVFTHTWFPITSGRHAGIACATCHTNATSYAVFSCLTTCHPRSDTDSNHRGISGYSYDSNRCYACHPTGRAG